jgi:hypothetical protein
MGVPSESLQTPFTVAVWATEEIVPRQRKNAEIVMNIRLRFIHASRPAAYLAAARF